MNKELRSEYEANLSLVPIDEYEVVVYAAPYLVPRAKNDEDAVLIGSQEEWA